MRYFHSFALASDYSGIIGAVFAIGVSVLVMVIAIYNSRQNRIKRALKKSPAKPIDRVQNGEYARVHGKAKFVGEPLIAPLSGRKCIYYHVQVEQKGSKNNYRRIINEFKQQDFFIQVGDQMALIKAQPEDRTLFYLVTDHSQKSGWKKDPTSQMETLLSRHGIKATTAFFKGNKTLRYKEAIIAFDETVTVKGIAQWKSLDTPIEGFSYSKILTLSSDEHEKLIVTDDPKHRKL